LEFIDQKKMAILLKYCDIGVVRAWTTSLAEQKLWDLILIMVPLPRTHDQQTNAEYYVRESHDELVVQDDDLELHLANTLREYLWYHKVLRDRERKKIVSRPKEIVGAYLLSSN
jgi:UDP-N-acetylglucosamine:LPS N-acetylglucosamine transferase